MSKFIPLTESDRNIVITFSIEQDDTGVRGNYVCTDDAEQDRADEDAILERLDAGDVTAWCGIIVTATYTDPVTGTETSETDSLWGVALEHIPNESGYSVGNRIEAYAREYGMVNEALASLNARLERDRTPRTVRMCTVKYSGTTDSHGSRYRARHCTTKRRVVVSYDPGLSEFENACAAAEKLFGRRPEFSTSVDGGGYIMGVDATEA
jgi:hypothetical protein